MLRREANMQACRPDGTSHNESKAPRGVCVIQAFIHFDDLNG